MTHFEPTTSHSSYCTPFKLNLIFLLIFSQVIFFGYLLALDTFSLFLISLFIGLPLALVSRFLLTRQVVRYTKMSIVMFATGGFGMLLGSVFDLGQFGIYGLLSICRSEPFSLFFWETDSLWLKFQLTPWSYIGMFVCGNIGMWLFDDLRIKRSLDVLQVIYIYMICNMGMLIGMSLGEGISSILMLQFSQFMAAAFMIIFMLLGMVIGMITLLMAANKLTNHRLLPVSYNFSDCLYDTANRPL